MRVPRIEPDTLNLPSRYRVLQHAAICRQRAGVSRQIDEAGLLVRAVINEQLNADAGLVLAGAVLRGRTSGAFLTSNP